MIGRLVLQSLALRPGRSLLLLVGYALGVGVTVALLSIGDALVEQSRDRDLVGGGDLVVLPAGIDLETLKTGGVGSLYFRIGQAAFFQREVLGGPRFAGRIAAAAPWIDDELLYRVDGPATVALSAGGRIPSTAAALGVSVPLAAGDWEDVPADRRWLAPGDSLLAAEIDAFHLPTGEAAGDSTWAEWHYFNVTAPDGSWWLYLTFLVGGEVPDGRWGGRILATLVEGERERVFLLETEADRVRFHLDRPDLAIGDARVSLDSRGIYHLQAEVPGAEGGDALRIEASLRREGRRYLPQVDVSPAGFVSGYVVPILAGRSDGRLCVAGRCREWSGAPGYHDHNWGVWREVTWDWGQARAGDLSILYGGVQGPAAGADGNGPGPASAVPAEGARFLFAVDSLGLRGVLPIRTLAYRWASSAGGAEAEAPGIASAGAAPPRRPAGFFLEAESGRERLTLDVRAGHVRASRRDPRAAAGDWFFQVRGAAIAAGRLLGAPAGGEGSGFFETWLREAEAGEP